MAVALAMLALAAPSATLSRTTPANQTSGRLVGPTGASGSVVVDQSGNWREMELADRGRDFDVRFNIASDKVATGRGQTVVVVARRVTRDTEYRVRLRFTADGGVMVAVVRLVRGHRSLIGPESRIARLTRLPGSPLALHLRVVGGQPTTIRLRAWPAGMAEPSAWSRVVTDWAAELARPGWLGVRFGVRPSATNLPVRYDYDGVRVTAADTADPPPDARPEPLPVLEPRPTVNPTPAVTPTGDPIPSLPPTPAPTARATSPPTAGPTSPPPTAPTPTPAPLPADAYVVAPTGNDAWTGSLAAPWRTLQKAADSVPAGGTVYVRGGTYAGFTLRRSGTAAGPITFAAYPGEQPIIDGRGAVIFTVRLSGVSHVRLSGLTVQGGFAESHDGGGVLITNSSNVEVRDCLLRDNKAFGIRSYNSTYVVIDGNEMTGNAVGVRIDRAGEGTRVTSNLIYDNDQMMVNTADLPDDDVGAEGVSLARSTGHVLVSGNYIWGNRALSYDYGYDGGAFEIYAASNWTISDNITWDNDDVLETGTDSAMTPCDGNTFTRNLNYGATTEGRTMGMILRCASNTLVANNTFSGIEYFVFALSHDKPGWGGSIDGLRIVDNIVSISTGKVFIIETALPASVVVDNDLLHVAGSAVVTAGVPGHGSTTSVATFGSWTGYELGGIQADPRFVDVAANDYRLRADSPAIDTARLLPGVNDQYAGAGPDIGYVERQ